jgi:DnaJ-class molecular chaperone
MRSLSEVVALMTEETRIEIQICPECCGTGFANHYLMNREERECWRCKGMGEVAISTDLVRADQQSGKT